MRARVLSQLFYKISFRSNYFIISTIQWLLTSSIVQRGRGSKLRLLWKLAVSQTWWPGLKAFKLKFPTRSFIAVQGLSTLDPEGHYRAFPRSLRGTDSEALYYIWQEKRDYARRKPFTFEIDLEFFHVSSILVDGLAGVVSILVQTNSCSVCCIHQYCRIPYQCCVYGRSSSGWTREHASFYCQQSSWECYHWWN